MAGYVLPDYWQVGYTVGDIAADPECHIVSEAILQATPENSDNVCHIISLAKVTAGEPTPGTGGVDAALEARVTALEYLVRDFLMAEDIQPLFNKYIDEVIFDA